jgi:uncharacterized membrane protein YqaE (UPF0057 family)
MGGIAEVRRPAANSSRGDWDRASRPYSPNVVEGAFCIPKLNFLDHLFGKQFWINILLTILGYIPGIVHAVWVIAKY